MNDQERKESQHLAAQLIPGDLILIRTPSTIYEVARKIGSSSFDHIVNYFDSYLP